MKELLIITTMALPSIHTIRIQKDMRQWLTKLKDLSMNFITTL